MNEQLFYYSLGSHLREVVVAVIDRNRRALSSHCKKAKDLLALHYENIVCMDGHTRINMSIFTSYSRMRMNIIFGDIFNFMSDAAKSLVEDLLLALQSIFGSGTDYSPPIDHVVLSDLCETSSKFSIFSYLI